MAETRPRSASNISAGSSVPSTSSPLATRRGRPPPISFSPVNSFIGSPGSVAASAYSASTSRVLSPLYLSFAAPPSASGSAVTATTSVPGVTRFKRGHARKKDTPVGARTMHPNDLDFSTLEDPDEVFRLFGVRDVRGLEKRAAEAAAGKVAELRTMVGARYRDLLSAADSIVRMRAAAEKLVERLDRVDSVVGGVGGGGELGTPSRRGPSKAPRRLSKAPEATRTLASPPTLSLTINLFLLLPSLVHSLLETSSFLPAARLEGVGRVIHRELSSFSYGTEDEDEPSGLAEAFPIIERQWESVASLGPGIVRRAIADLRLWETTPITTAETLASILVLENASLPSSLTLLLEARSKSLAAILDQLPRKSKAGKTVHEVDNVLENLREVLGLVLHTVKAATEVFGASTDSPSSEGLLLQLLREIENPTASTLDEESPKLHPTLFNLPNYPLLRRHLPASILGFTPFLSISSPRNALLPVEAHAQIHTWLSKETDRVVSGVKTWVADLRGGARTLARVRGTVRTSLANAGPEGLELKRQLEDAIEERLETVYKAHLAAVVDRVEPCLTDLLASLPTSDADLDPARFLFDTPLAFPPPSHYALPSRLAHSSDPFDSFYEKVTKRVQGRSPLIDKGLGELESHAKDLRKDLEGWLGGVTPHNAGVAVRDRLRQQYVHSAKDTLDGVYSALSSVLEDVSSDVTASLFIGNFAFMLSQSPTFARDLLLGSAPVHEAQEDGIMASWQQGLSALQAKSLQTWRASAVRDAVEQLELASKTIALAAQVSTSGLLTNRSTSTLATPSQPSAGVLAALRVLVSAMRKVGPHRTHADPTIAKTLLAELEVQALPLRRSIIDIANELASEERRNVALQAAWDMAFLDRIIGPASAAWRQVQQELWNLTGEDAAAHSRLEASTLHYLQRTQTVLSPLLSGVVPTPYATVPDTMSTGTLRLLPWGVPSAGHDFRATVGVVRPGARLGLLPTR